MSPHVMLLSLLAVPCTVLHRAHTHCRAFDLGHMKFTQPLSRPLVPQSELYTIASPNYCSVAPSTHYFLVISHDVQSLVLLFDASFMSLYCQMVFMDAFQSLKPIFTMQQWLIRGTFKVKSGFKREFHRSRNRLFRRSNSERAIDRDLSGQLQSTIQRCFTFLGNVVDHAYGLCVSCECASITRTLP
jgi:hypothetical protein